MIEPRMRVLGNLSCKFRQAISVCLAAAVLLLYGVPAAALLANAGASCCHSKSGCCCHRHKAGWSAAPACGQNCCGAGVLSADGGPLLLASGWVQGLRPEARPIAAASASTVLRASPP